MANVMSMKDVRNKVHRSGADLSFRNCYSQKVGEILPAGALEVKPGDHYRIKISNYGRTIPANSPSLGRYKQYVDAYFVPNSLIWDKFPNWVIQTQQPVHAETPIGAVAHFTSQPYILPSTILEYLTALKSKAGTIDEKIDTGGLLSLYTTLKLLENLGYGCFYEGKINTDSFKLVNPHLTNEPLNPFPLLAYQKVYQDYFRFAQWEDAAPWTYNLDYVLDEGSLDFIGQYVSDDRFLTNSNLFDMQYCNLDKDFFTGLLPRAQFGDEAIAGPISGTLAGNLEMISAQESVVSGSNFSLGAKGSGSHYSLVNAGSSGAKDVWATAQMSLNNSHVDSAGKWSNTAGLSILLLRQGQMAQKWKEITISGDLDFKSQMEKIWNVKVSQDQSFKCRYLGGCSQTITFDEVVNQNLQDGGQADTAGLGSVTADGYINFTSNEYGVILILSHIKPIIEWSNRQTFHPFMHRHLSSDYANPVFDNLGMQALWSNSLYYWANLEPVPLGYGPRYFDYKTSYDRANGLFLEPPYNAWIILHDLHGVFEFNPTPAGNALLSPSFFRATPDFANNLFTPQAEPTPLGSSFYSDVFLNSLYADIKLVQNLSYDGLPY